MQEGSLFSILSPGLFVDFFVDFFDDGHSDKCEVMPHCSFDLHSLIMSKIKTAEHQIIDAFELGCWRRLLRVPWTARRSNQSIVKEISPEYSLVRTDAETEAPILWPPEKLQYFGHSGKDPEAGKD